MLIFVINGITVPVPYHSTLLFHGALEIGHLFFKSFTVYDSWIQKWEIQHELLLVLQSGRNIYPSIGIAV